RGRRVSLPAKRPPPAAAAGAASALTSFSPQLYPGPRLRRSARVWEDNLHGRVMKALEWFEQAWQDLRFGALTLAANPGFALLAVLSLALGITATPAVYSVVHAVVLDPFPYRDVDRLMSVRVSDLDRPG